jgi:hypothetical protein
MTKSVRARQVAAVRQELTLVNFPAQRKRFPRYRVRAGVGYGVSGGCQGVLWGV